MDGGAHWRHLVNTTEPSMYGGDAALCQIDHLLVIRNTLPSSIKCIHTSTLDFKPHLQVSCILLDNFTVHSGAMMNRR